MTTLLRRILARPSGVTRSLRFRLTLTYVLFFTILLSFLGIFFRETIRSIYDTHSHAILDEEWAAVRGYLRIEKPKRRSRDPRPEINWYYDRDDPEEALIVDRLRQVYRLADSAGNTLQISPRYLQLPQETPEEIRQFIKRKSQTAWKTVNHEDDTPYLVRTGVMTAEDDKLYYVAIGRSNEEQARILAQFSWYYGWILPSMIVSAAVLGWFMAGRALVPVNQLAQTAERITSLNMAVEIPSRNCNDELDRLIESFNHMIGRLERSFTQTRQFSTDVSHELRTPLTAIRGQLEVALLTATTTEHYQDAILDALQDVERLSKTIRALLLLSQAESGQLALSKEPVDLQELVVARVEEFQIPAEGARVHLSIARSEPVVIEADRIQIERLLSNLLSNAVKYTPADGKLTVSVYPADNESAELVISDTGVGIAPDHLPYIFDRFYRVPSAERQRSDNVPERGLGLGLSFVAWIVRAHGGTINVWSQPGSGTTFTVRLPKGNPASDEPTTTPAPEHAVRV
ncbi:MAG: HAMP domain-containing protein [Bryobacteraceae bacterium]|nr:HAMP domain-containing protein [Bryobacteraceae bacterium]